MAFLKRAPPSVAAAGPAGTPGLTAFKSVGGRGYITNPPGLTPFKAPTFFTAVSRHLGVRHGKRSSSSQLGIHQIATVPSWSVLWLASAFGGALYLSSKFQINVGYAIAFFGFTVLMTSSWISYVTMRGLRLLAPAQVGACRAGEPMRFEVEVEETLGRRRRHLIVHAGVHQYELAIEPRGRVKIEFEAPTNHRGRLIAPMIKLSTPYPLGLWNTHHLWAPDQSGLVHPRAEVGAPPLAGIEEDDGGADTAVRLGDDGSTLVSMRAYRPGDSPRRMAWKVYAKSDGNVLATKQAEVGGNAPKDLRVEEAAVAHLGNPEQRISRLCAWVHQAHATGQPYSFRAAGVSMEASKGEEHLAQCLKALSMAAGFEEVVAFESPGKKA